TDGPLPENFDVMSEASKTFLRGIADGRDAPFATIFALGKLPFPLPKNIGSDIDSVVARHANFQTADEALEALDDFGFWTRPWMELGMTWESKYGNPTVWARLFQKQKLDYAAKRQLVLSLDEAPGEAHFRKQFAAACINGDKVRMLTLIEGAIDELDSLTGADREGFASVLKAWFPYYSAAGAPEEVKAFFRSLGGGVVKANLEEAQALIDNGFRNIDLGYSGRERLSAKIPGFIFSDAGVAAELVAGLLVELHRRENDPLDTGRYFRYSSSDGFSLHAADAFYGDVAEACGESDLETKDFIQFLAELAKHDAERLLGARNRGDWPVQGLMRRGWERWALEESGLEGTRPGAATWAYVRNTFSSESDAFKSTLVNQTLLHTRSLRWNLRSTQEMRIWLKEALKEEIDPIFARGCTAIVAIRSWDSPQGSMKEKAIDAWVGLLGDAGIPSRERLELMWSASEERSHLLEEVAVRDAIGELLESYLDERRPVVSPVVHGIISRLGEHISDADQFDWGAFTARFAPLIFGAEAHDISPEVRDSFRLPLVKLGLGGGADEIAADLVDTGHGSEGDLSTVLNFAALGRLEVAAKMAETLPSHFSIPDLAWTPQIAQDLQKLLRKIGDEGEKYWIECLVSALADAPDIEINERRDDRLSRLAAGFHKRAPDDPVKRNACLVALVNSQGHRMTAAILEDEIAAVASEWSLAEVLESGELSWGAAKDISLIIYVAVGNAAWESGDISVAARQLESLFLSGGGMMDQPYESKLVSCAGFYISDYLSYLERTGKPVTERVLSQSETWLQLAASGGRRNISAQRVALGIAVALHAIAGKGAKLDEFIESLNSSEKEIYERALSNRSGLPTMWSTGWWRQEGKEPGRRRYVRSFANDRATSAREFQSPIDMARLIRSKTILPDEFVSEVALFPADTFRLEWWKLIAAYQRALLDSRTREASLAELESIGKNASATGDPFLAACALGYRAIATAGAWDTKEELETASELMQLVDLEALPESEKRSFENHLKIWRNLVADR
ncbi:hypothetical protein OAF27_03190, partial [Verrucomicrobiales bacterium]|nr:hypothetical protein [Verrucomicrobiales bacterium]